MPPSNYHCARCEDTGAILETLDYLDSEPYVDEIDCPDCPICFGCSYPIALHGEGFEIKPGEQFQIAGNQWHPACWLEYVGAMQEEQERRYQAAAPARGIAIGASLSAMMWTAAAMWLGIF